MRIFQSDAIKKKGEIKGYNILIIDGEKQYSDTAENFKLDGGATIETAIIYNDDDGFCVIDNQYKEYPNNEFNGYIDNIDTYIAAKEERTYVEPPEPTEDEKLQLEASIAKSQLKEKAVTVMMMSLVGGDTTEAQTEYQTSVMALSDGVALKIPDIFPTWSGDSKEYKKGERLNYNGTLYKVLQDHTSQSTWTPTDAPSLFAKVLTSTDGTIPEWEQPDSTNGYMKGDKVQFEGKIYESTIDNNVWSPTAYPQGWKEITEQEETEGAAQSKEDLEAIALT